MLWFHTRLLEIFDDVLHITFFYYSFSSLDLFWQGRHLKQFQTYEKNAPYLIDVQTNPKQTNPKPRTPMWSVYCKTSNIYGGGWELDSICLLSVFKLLSISVKLKQFMEPVKWILKFSDNARTVISLRYCCLTGWLRKRIRYLWTRPFDQKLLID